MSDYLFLAPITFIAILGAIVGLYAKYRESHYAPAGEPLRVSFNLSDAQSQKLRKEADCLGIQPSDLARAALTDLLDGDGDFRDTIARVLQKKADIYKRSA
jgi:hypothetical protein